LTATWGRQSCRQARLLAGLGSGAVRHHVKWSCRSAVTSIFITGSRCLTLEWKSMRRREFLSALAAATLSAQNPAQKPNIIFILADDLGMGDVGCYGQKIIRTPNIDRIAAEGIRFTQAYAGDTVCAPSRCALMTGMHSGHGR